MCGTCSMQGRDRGTFARLQRKIPLEKPARSCEDTIKINLREGVQSCERCLGNCYRTG